MLKNLPDFPATLIDLIKNKPKLVSLLKQIVTAAVMQLQRKTHVSICNDLACEKTEHGPYP